MASNGNVTCRCKFYVYEGRDEVEVSIAGRKRKQHSNIQYFTKPFLPGKYRSHHLDECSNDYSDDNMHAADVITRKAAKKANQKTNAMRLFDQQDDGYIVTIKNIMRFKLTMDHISIGMSR
ncbi:unnamed protein product [Sphagnum troendelagicum]